MACYSRIENTTMTDVAQLVAALRAEGVDVRSQTQHSVVGVVNGESISFSRSSEKQGFSTTTYALQKLRAVQRKYSELGVRKFAKANGYTVAQEGQRITLKRTRS